ncbi:MAG: hypothetical protein ACOYEV_06340 [Candidatus Nanopelagicales bacterium]
MQVGIDRWMARISERTAGGSQSGSDAIALLRLDRARELLVGEKPANGTFD